MPHARAGKPAPETEGKKHDHTLAGAATLSGAAAGAVIGAMAGPIGAVAGGAIGTAVGAIAGIAMEREDIRHEARERELDDAIGVTRGSLGEPEEHKRPSLPPAYDEAAEEPFLRGERTNLTGEEGEG